MSDHFADRLLAACRAKGAPVCVGLDPVIERLPAELREALPAVEAIEAFSLAVIDAVAEHVPAVKPQSACFERYGPEGVRVYEKAIAHARQRGLIVVGDAKRGDIGISAGHYAAGCLADAPGRPGPDSLTINAYFGRDGIEPFIDIAKAQHKGLFALVRTSNPGGDALQALRLEDGRSVAEAVAQVVAELGETCVGDSGYSCLGAVVGATKPEDAARLRRILARQIFLVPGFGAQGGSADDVKACFNEDKQGALITASRSVLFAYENAPDRPWRNAIADAALEMKRQVAAILA